MKAQGLAAAILALSPCVPAPPGKSTIAAHDALHALSFNLKYLPVTVAEDNGPGDSRMGQIEGRVQVLQNTSYTERNCQLFSSKGSLSAGTKYQSMTPNGVGSDCSYSSGKKYTGATEMHKVFANNQNQCCNACVAQDGCVAATFETSAKDHTGGQGPQSWEGFGIHITDVTSAKTTGGITVAELSNKFEQRFGDFSTFDSFMDYSVTFFTYDLQPYADAFKADGVPFFTGQWQDSETKDQWYSLIFRVASSHYVIELVSAQKPTVNSEMPQMEQRMSHSHTQKFKSYGKHPANVLLISSINRATSDMSTIADVYGNLFKGTVTHKIDTATVKRQCFTFASSGLSSPPGPGMSLDEHVCFTQRMDAEDKSFSVLDFEEMLWAEHAATIGNNANSKIDKYTDNHYALPLPSAGLTALASYFQSNDPYPITAKTRLAYACKQSYIIDPTGWSIQPIGPASWPRCSFAESVAV